MRALGLLLLLICAACDRHEGAGRAPAAFDGAMVADAGARIAHGERLTRVLGCRGCHGADLRGQLWDNDPRGYGVMWASNLTRAIPLMTDAQLRALLTRGMHPDDRDMWVMPSELFQHLGEKDLTALLAYLRTLPAVGARSPPPVLGPRAIAEAKSGEVKPAAIRVAELRTSLPPDFGPAHRLARYITSVTCAECHGPELKGVAGDTPSLVVAATYSRDEFERLITSGVASGGRKLHPLMQSVARNRFAYLTPRERDSLYAYFRRLAEQPAG